MARRTLLSWLSLGTALFSACEREVGEEDYARLRERMVSKTIEGRGVRDPRVLRAMRTVRRHQFVPVTNRRSSYVDDPLPIGWGQTISQPYIVAYMTEAVLPEPGDRCLEVGTGSGYQAAVLAELCGRVFSIEYLPELKAFAERNLRSQGYGPERVELKQGDGYQGWREAAPFRVILVTAAPHAVPEPLLEQLDVGGRLIAPVGPSLDTQQLELWIRTWSGPGRVRGQAAARGELRPAVGSLMASRRRSIGWVLLAAVLGLPPGGCRRRDREEPRPMPSASAGVTMPPVVASAEAGAPDGGAREELVVVLGGDVNLGRGIGRRIWGGKQPRPFAGLAPVLSAADLVFVNLESQLSDQHGETQSSWSPLVFTGPPGGADLLAEAGIHAVSLANNHIWDYGKQAFFETLTHLERAGVAYVGASREPDRMYEPVVLRIKGFSVALFAVTEIWNQGPLRGHSGEHQVAWADYDRLEGPLRAARGAYDVVLLGYHGGGEYMEGPLPALQKFAERVMQTGLDAFAGHHPHVPQGIGWHADRPIFYSLGNLIFHMHRDFPWTGTSFLARLTFRRDRSLRVEACPYYILGNDPLLFEGPGREVRERRIRRHLAVLSYPLGGVSVGEPAEHSCMLLSPRTK